MTDTADEIVRFLADERGKGVETIGATDRLLEDLGMDGDDAVEFFEAFGPRFGIDLTPLYEHWDQHFGPEGFGPPWIGPPLVAMLVCIGLFKLGAPPEWSWAVMGLGVALAARIAWKHWARRNRPHIPLRVQDLLNAAKSGRWSVSYAYSA
jgi:hypothetical protein